jgi:hypothetical protein
MRLGVEAKRRVEAVAQDFFIQLPQCASVVKQDARYRNKEFDFAGLGGSELL